MRSCVGSPTTTSPAPAPPSTRPRTGSPPNSPPPPRPGTTSSPSSPRPMVCPPATQTPLWHPVRPLHSPAACGPAQPPAPAKSTGNCPHLGPRKHRVVPKGYSQDVHILDGALELRCPRPVGLWEAEVAAEQ